MDNKPASSQPLEASPSATASPKKTGEAKPSGSRISPRIQAMKEAKKREMKKDQSALIAEMKDPYDNAVSSKAVVKGKTGLVYSAEMLEHKNPWDENHIEKPERLLRTYERCKELGLVDRCQEIPCRKATDEEIHLVHSAEHVSRLKELVAQDVEKVKDVCLKNYHSVYINQSSLECARLAVGAAIDLTTAILTKEVQNGIALVRPPGHHAMKNEFCGFCLFNNVAVAAKHALKNFGLKRILIVDFDVHHGQATQQEFFDDPRVLYMSIHRYEHGKFWPHLRESDFDVIGSGEGKGFNVNVPLNETNLKDSDYLAIFQNLILPIAYEFNPELVLVSAGMDAAIGCPEGQMRLSPMIYGHIVSSLMALASGKVAVILEGGYFIESLAEGVAMTLRSLLGDPCRLSTPFTAPCQSVTESIYNCIAALREHWSNLCVQEQYSISEYDASVDKNCHEPILTYEGSEIALPRNLSQVSYEPGNFYFTHSEEEKKSLLEELHRMIVQSSTLVNQSIQRKKLSIVYDEAMNQHKNIQDPVHPETPMRIVSIYEKLKEFGILDRSEVMQIDSRRATEEEILLVHENEYLNYVKQLPAKTQSELNEAGEKFDSIFFTPESFDCALLSCGSLLNLVDSVCNGDCTRGLAVIRPPGHHAEEDEACGFCLFNNVAVAAKYAIQFQGLKRVLILDWDVHHGNGIQNMFYEDPRVLYVSIHRFDRGTFFPGRMDADYDHVGEGAGKGFNVNIPWNGPGMGDVEYLNAFFTIVLPIAYEFNPELILISSGFDAAVYDPLGRCKVSPEMFGHMTKHLQNLAQGRVIAALEGGYNLETISLCATQVAKAMIDDPLPPVDCNTPPKQGALQSIRDVIRVQSEFWQSLKFGKKLPDSFEDLKMQLMKTPKKERENLKSDSFTPREYGEFVPANLVNTLSFAGYHNRCELILEPAQTKSPQAKPEKKKNEDELVKGMSGMSVTPQRIKPNCTEEYIPSEYGPTFSTPSVNTFCNTTSGAKLILSGSLDKPVASDHKQREDEKK